MKINLNKLGLEKSRLKETVSEQKTENMRGHTNILYVFKKDPVGSVKLEMKKISKTDNAFTVITTDTLNK